MIRHNGNHRQWIEENGSSMFYYDGSDDLNGGVRRLPPESSLGGFYMMTIHAVEEPVTYVGRN